MLEETTTSTDARVAGVDTTTAQAAITSSTDAQVADSTETTGLSHEDARKLRSEAANLRKRLKSYQDQEEQAEHAALSEVEKATKRAAEADRRVQQYQQQLVSARVTMAAKDMGIIDPELAALAVREKLEYDDDGMPTNLLKVLEDLVKSKPYLKPEAAAPIGNAPRTPALPAMNPGRTSIQSPNALKPGKIPRVADVFATNRKK